MATRKQNVKVTSINEHAIVFYADERHVIEVKQIEGVTSVDDLNAPCWIAFIDKRYDRYEIAKEIEELNTEPSIPSVFSE